MVGSLSKIVTLNQINYLIAITVFALTAIWCIPNTIAARYSLLFILYILLIVTKNIKINWGDPLFKTLLIFISYLILSIFLPSNDYLLVIKNIKSEWLKFIIFAIAGFSLAFIRCNKLKILIVLGLGFSIISYIYLALFIISGETSHPKIIEHHGYIAYSSLTSTILLFPLPIYGNLKKNVNTIIVITLLINMVAVIVSNSRGGILFNILVIVLNLIIYIYLFRKLNVIRKILLSILFLVFIIGSFNIILMKNQDNKWKNLLNVIYLIKIDNPLDLLCNGTENFRRNNEINGKVNKNLDDAITDLQNEGTAARLITAMVSFELLKDNWFGKNVDTKNSFRLELEKVCNRIPKISLANSHNGWLDITHAFGIIGTCIFMLFFIYPIIISFKFMRQATNTDYLITVNLFTFTLIWACRGFVDATMRDHMLEMQGFIIFYLYGLFRQIKKDN